MSSAGLVPLCLAMLVRCDQFAAILVEPANPLQIQRDVSPLAIAAKTSSALEMAQVMHDCVVALRISSASRNRIAHPRQAIHSRNDILSV